MKKLLNWLTRNRQVDPLAEWERRGRPVPPPHVVKQRVLRGYAERYHLKIFVETGTYRGDMVEAMKHLFHRIYSIELSDTLFAAARRRFRRDSHIELLHGDSSQELGRIMERVDQPVLFWLDGHYSAGDTARGEKDTPICDELAEIFRAPELSATVNQLRICTTGLYPPANLRACCAPSLRLAASALILKVGAIPQSAPYRPSSLHPAHRAHRISSACR